MTSVKDEWGMECPNCHKDDRFKVEISVMAILCVDGTDPVGDQTWDEDSFCCCSHCDWNGTVDEAKLAHEGTEGIERPARDCSVPHEEVFRRPMLTLIDGVALNQSNPETFQIPTDEEKANIKPGDSVKIGIADHDEQFWVTIETVAEEHFFGRVDNHLLTDEISFGETITFQKRHVLTI